MNSDADLEEAIRYLRIAIRLHSPEAPFELAEALVQLGLCFGARYHFSGSLEDLKEYSASLRKAVDATPKEHPSRGTRLAMFKTSVQEHYAKISALMKRWKMKINPDNLVEWERLPVQARDVVVSTKDGSLLPVTATQNQPSTDPVQNGDGRNDANQAIDLLRHGIDILTPDNEHYEKFLVELITALALRHSTNMTSRNSIADLEETIRLCGSFLQIETATQSNKLKVMAIYSRNLVLRFKRLGVLGDLNEAIQVRRKLLNLETETEGNIPRLLNLHFLSASLLSRCQRTGSKDDMDETIAIRRKLLHYPPPSEEYRISMMNSLVLALRLRCAMLHSLKDLDEAIQLQNEILDLTSEDDESRPHALNELGVAFLQRFVSGKDPEDLAMAIRLCREAVDTDSSMTLDRRKIRCDRES
jgi:tetratricopeptide (TPR) repeat protein